MSIAVGDRVKVTKPEVLSGVSCILASYDAAYLVVDVMRGVLMLKTRITGMPDKVGVTIHEVTKVEDRPWWEAAQT